MRTTLDLPFEGHTRTEDYALGDLKIDGALADTDFHIFSSEHGSMGLFPMGGEHFRLIASNPCRSCSAIPRSRGRSGTSVWTSRML